MSAGFELSSDLRVHCNHLLILLGHEQVTLLHLLLDPRFEWLSDHVSAHVADPLLGRLSHVWIVWQELVNVWVLVGELKDDLECEVLVLWHVDGLADIILHSPLLVPDEVLQKVDGHVFCIEFQVSRHGTGYLP